MSENKNIIRPIELEEGELHFYQQYGFLTIPGLVEKDIVADLREEVLTVLEANGVKREQLDNATSTADKLRQVPQYLAGSLLDNLINGEHTLSLIAQLIGGRAIRYLPFTAVKAGGGGGEFHFHQDNNYTQHEPALGSINLWVALDEMTPDNGCLRMVPQSHLEGVLDWENAGDGDAHRKVAIEPKNFLPIRMHPGDAVAFTRLTVHGSGPNSTERARVAYALQYHREDVKFYNIQNETWERLTETPRFQTEPITALGQSTE